jgi:hypothetical protein
MVQLAFFLKLSKLVARPADEVATELTPQLAVSEITGFTAGGNSCLH